MKVKDVFTLETCEHMIVLVVVTHQHNQAPTSNQLQTPNDPCSFLNF